jgi:hypothetical protein
MASLEFPYQPYHAYQCPAIIDASHQKPWAMLGDFHSCACPERLAEFPHSRSPHGHQQWQFSPPQSFSFNLFTAFIKAF